MKGHVVGRAATLEARAMMLRGAAALIVGVTLVSAGCFGGDVTGPLDPSEATFHSSLGIDLDAMTRMPSGLYYEDVTVGDGELAVEGATATVHYTGWFRDGSVFDTSLGGEPRSFLMEEGEVIQGFLEGVVGMREGGTRKLVVPWQLGYGSAPFQGVPAYSILVFRIELFEVALPEEEEDPA